MHDSDGMHGVPICLLYHCVKDLSLDLLDYIINLVLLN
jgi:hypothetical protein